jgi:hypothetical protein
VAFTHRPFFAGVVHAARRLSTAEGHPDARHLTRLHARGYDADMKRWLPRLIPIVIILALLSLALAYWGRWIAHPAAGLNILGVDLPEYVKFVPEVRYGVIPINRLLFFAPPVALSAGLILFASMRARLWLGLRILAAALAVPAALSMLPPAWTPGVLMTAEFRAQTVIIMLLVLAAFLTPLWKTILPDTVRGALFILLGLMNLPALFAFYRLLPALEKLYNKPLSSGPGATFLILGLILMIAAGVLLMIGASRAGREEN